MGGCPPDSRAVEPFRPQASIVKALVVASVSSTALFIWLWQMAASSQQTITLKVARDGVPVAGLLVRVHVAERFGREPCDARNGIYFRTGMTDESGVAQWVRPIRSMTRRTRDPRFGHDAQPEGRKVRICAVIDGETRQIFSEAEGQKFERRLNVTCDLAHQTYLKCDEEYAFSWDRALMAYVFLPLWLLLCWVLVKWRGDRVTGIDILGFVASMSLAFATHGLQRYWALSQVLAVFAVAAVLITLVYAARSREGLAG